MKLFKSKKFYIILCLLLVICGFTGLYLHKKVSIRNIIIAEINNQLLVQNKKADINNIIMDLKRANVEETNPPVLNEMKD